MKKITICRICCKIYSEGVIEINITKNQHYVSQGILKHFADEKKKTVELYIDKGIISKKAIDNTMSQNYVYEHPRIETNSIEDLFCAFESRAFPIMDKLIADFEKDYSDGRSIEKYKSTIDNMIPYVLLFYFRSGALLKEYSMDADNPKVVRVERMLLNIMDVEYVRGLRNTICQYYDVAVIVDERGSFLLSDQYVSTVALKYKNRFSNASNRQIGMKETMILVPLSSKFYIVFYNGRKPNYIIKNKFCVLSEESVQEINNVIIQNSYVKCVGKCVQELNRVKSISVKSSPTKCIVQYADGSIRDRIIKREVFFYKEDSDMNEHSLEYMRIYDEKVKGKIGRNDFCVCGSGKKYKKCCLRKYELVAQILMGVQNQKGVNYTIPGVEWTEDSILEYQGPRDKISNQHDKEILDEIMKMVQKNEKN